MERLGDNFPPQIIKNQIFVEGGAFLKQNHQFGNEEPKTRPFFILNKDPIKDDRIIVVYPTTQQEKRKRKRLLEVLVEVKADECKAVKKDSIIDCESYKIWHKSEVERLIRDKDISLLPRLSNDLLQKLRKAIANSKTLAPIAKRLIFPEE